MTADHGKRPSVLGREPFGSAVRGDFPQAGAAIAYRGEKLIARERQGRALVRTGEPKKRSKSKWRRERRHCIFRHASLDEAYTPISFLLVSGSRMTPMTKVSAATPTVYQRPANMLPVATTTAVATNGAKPPIQPLPNCSEAETPL